MPVFEVEITAVVADEIARLHKELNSLRYELNLARGKLKEHESEMAAVTKLRDLIEDTFDLGPRYD